MNTALFYTNTTLQCLQNMEKCRYPMLEGGGEERREIKEKEGKKPNTFPDFTTLESQFQNVIS